MTERAVRDALAVGRHRDVPQRLHLKVGGMDLLREAERFVQRLLDVRGERHGRTLAARHVHLPDLSFSPDHNRLAVRGPRVLRVQPVDRPGFLQVLVQMIENRAVASCLEIAEIEPARGADAAT